MKFEKLKIEDWKQFKIIETEFHPKLTILTGANSSGKTTILNLLAQHFGRSAEELSTPTKDITSGIIRFFARLWKDVVNNTPTIGKLTYDDSTEGILNLPQGDSATYNISIEGRKDVKGLYIPSHRPVFSYRAISQLPTKKRSRSEAFSLVANSMWERTFGNSGVQPSNYHIKETLLTWAVYGFGNEAIESDQEQIDNYKQFEEVLKKVLPKQLGFNRFTVRNSEVVLDTESGQFMIDAVSGGVSAIIDMAWQIFMLSSSLGEENFVVLIDEIENHLHATMQRTVLPDFIHAFPNAQFIVSTHSPLIVGSVEESNVYALQFGEDNRVVSIKLDLINKSKSASDILRDVLGVPFTMPIWVENKLGEITQKYTSEKITDDLFIKMREELKNIGLEYLIPDAISKVVEDKKTDTNDKAH